MAEVNDLWNTAETIKAALTQTTDKEPAQPDPVGWVCAIEQAVAVADAKRQKYATAAHEKPDPWAQNAAKSLCADDISAAIRALITQPQHDALQAAIDAARKVKPLDWSDAEYPNECWNAGDYDIWSEHGGFQVYHWSIKTGDLHHDLKAAQDAAFTHHETRVQSFLAQIGAKP